MKRIDLVTAASRIKLKQNFFLNLKYLILNMDTNYIRERFFFYFFFKLPPPPPPPQTPFNLLKISNRCEPSITCPSR